MKAGSQKSEVRSQKSVNPTSDLRPPPSPYFLPYQDKWIDDNTSFKLYEKSRRIGITYGTSYRCFQKCMKRKQNFTQWVSSRDLLTAKEFVTDYLRLWCERANIVAKGLAGDNVHVFDTAKDIRAFVVEFPTGARIVSLSSTPEVFAGKGGDVLLDEVDLHDDPGRLIDMAMPCTTWGGQLEAISAYKVDGSPSSVFARLCADAKAANPMHASFHRTTIEDAVNAGFVEKINEVTGSNWTRAAFLADVRSKCRTEAAWQSQFMCNPQDDGGALLPYQLIADCEADPKDLLARSLDPGQVYLGADIGRKHDLTAIWILRRVAGVLWSLTPIVLEKTLFRDQLSVIAGLIEKHNVTRACIDSTGIGAMLAEELQLRFGPYRVEPVVFTNAVKLDLGMPMLQAFQDKAVRIPASPDIREDLHKVRKTATAAGNVRLEAESDDSGHADRFWALALALQAAGSQVAQFAPHALADSARGRVILDRRDRSIAA